MRYKTEFFNKIGHKPTLIRMDLSLNADWLKYQQYKVEQTEYAS